MSYIARQDQICCDISDPLDRLRQTDHFGKFEKVPKTSKKGERWKNGRSFQKYTNNMSALTSLACQVLFERFPSQFKNTTSKVDLMKKKTASRKTQSNPAHKLLWQIWCQSKKGLCFVLFLRQQMLFQI